MHRKIHWHKNYYVVQSRLCEFKTLQYGTRSSYKIYFMYEKRANVQRHRRKRTSAHSSLFFRFLFVVWYFVLFSFSSIWIADDIFVRTTIHRFEHIWEQNSINGFFLATILHHNYGQGEFSSYKQNVLIKVVRVFGRFDATFAAANHRRQTVQTFIYLFVVQKQDKKFNFRAEILH